MFRTILLAIDPGHRESWASALPQAAALARASGGTLHLLSVVPDFGMTMVAGYFPEDFEVTALQRARAELDAFAEAEAPKDVACEVHVGHGHVPGQIIACAERIGADLIVLASQQPDLLHTLVLGSNADRIVHAAPVSVLVVRG